MTFQITELTLKFQKSNADDFVINHQYSIEQISEHLEQIIQDVEQGTAVQLIRQGERVAVILSTTEYDLLLREKLGFGQALERFRQEYNVEEANINPDEVFKDVRNKLSYYK